MSYKAFVPGLRIIKTALAVFICLVLFSLFNYPQSTSALIACILMMKETTDLTKKTGADRIKGTLLGGLVSYVGLLLVVWMGREQFSMPIILSLSVLVALSISKGLAESSSVGSMAAVMIVITIVTHGDSTAGAFAYVVIRTIETLIGIVIAYFVNKLFLVNEK